MICKLQEKVILFLGIDFSIDKCILYVLVKYDLLVTRYMRYAVIYYLLLWILFFSPTYAVDTSFYPDIENNVWNENNLVRKFDTTYSRDGYNVSSISFKWDERINNLVQVQQKICLDTIWPWDHWNNWYNYSCENQTLTRTAENWWWHRDRVSPTSDYWLCQLHYKRHKNFIDSEEFKDPINQIEYCQEVWEDAYKKWRMPWMAYSNRNKMKERFLIQ